VEIPILDLGPELAEVADELGAAFRRVVASGHFILGPEVEAFEREAAAYLGARHAIGVNSGTDALVLALRALGIGPGHEVITTAFSFFATAEAVSSVGATPVFADIDPASFNLRPELVERALTSRTRALLPVHLFGGPADMAALQAIAQPRGLPVIEDAAQSFGALHGERRAGTLGAFGAYSFFPSKTLGCLGDGGLLSTDDDRLAGEVRALRAHGARRKYFNETVGYNSRLDALQAAFLRVKLPRLEEWNAARRQAAARYGRLLDGARGIVLPAERAGTRHVFHQFTIRVTGGRREALRAHLAARGIATMVYYPMPIHQSPVYAAARVSCPEAELASSEVLSLPLWPRIGEDVQGRVAAEIRAFCDS
jgi:dTDP-4-amino-4,6-dideoxygalactose transaminase